jgi:hypothetical protein
MESCIRLVKRECVPGCESPWRLKMTYRLAFPRTLLIATAIIAFVVATGCESPRSPATGPSAPGTISANQNGAAWSSDESASRRGEIHLTKECSVYTGMAGSYCTITKSNLSEIAVGSREFALRDADLVGGTLNSDGVLYVRDGELALNHCAVNIFVTAGVMGSCTFSGGIGHLSGFRADVVVSVNKDNPNQADFDGTYSFSRRD